MLNFLKTFFVFFLFFSSFGTVFSCLRLRESGIHNLTQHLSKNKKDLVKILGEPIASKSYGKATRMEYNGKFGNIEGIWAYYLVPELDFIVSADFTAKGRYGDIFSKIMAKNLGNPLTLEQLTTDIEDGGTRLSEFAAKQIKSNYENGMRVWVDNAKDITYALNIEKDKESDHDSVITSVVSIQSYQKRPKEEKTQKKKNSILQN